MSEALPITRMTRLAASSVGRKAVVAITGILLIGFLVGHLAGNLQVLISKEAFNSYAHWMQSNPLLWPARIGLLALFVAHVVFAISCSRASKAARPIGYRAKLVAQESSVSRYMLLTGILVLAFIIYHLLHFTLGVVQPDAYGLVDDKGRHDAYAMFVRGFQSPLIASSYVVAMIVLWFHLRHGATSLFQTLGISQPVWNGVLRGGMVVVITLIVLGNIALPLLCLLGVVTE